MRAKVIDDANELIGVAREVYADDEAATEVLLDLERRLHEPLRVAIAGMVKAGKSTLLNAMLGERIAPTDAGECTRVVTWYRYADTPTMTLHPHEGEPERMPVRRSRGHLVMDISGRSADEIKWIDVGWPSEVLKSAILIDTPGIASISQDVSLRSTAFLTPEDSPSAADAIVYLLRHLHASDVRFLEAFRDHAAGQSQTVNAIAALSRADEIGSGRIDSLLSARKVAHRYELDGDLSRLALAVVPVAGLLAEGARTLRESEFRAFRTLASMDRSDRERLLVSADRFARLDARTTLNAAERRQLLATFGIFGVRLATSLIRGGATTSSELAEQLAQQSGLAEITQYIQRQFRDRGPILKVRGVVDALERLVEAHPRERTDTVVAGIERIRATAHGLRELLLLAQLHTSSAHLSEPDADSARRIVGGYGAAATDRLGLDPGAALDEVRTRVAVELDRWRAMIESPLIRRDAVEVCRLVLRSLEQVASEVSPGTTIAPAHVVLADSPRDGAGKGTDEQG